MTSEKKNRTVQTREFKVEAVKLALQGDRSLQEVADNLGIHISNLRRWNKAYLTEGDHAFPWARPTAGGRRGDTPSASRGLNLLRKVDTPKSLYI